MSTIVKRELKPAERLIVAADFKPDHRKGENRNSARFQVRMLADKLALTGVYLKLESNLRGDYNLIKDIHSRGLNVMADLKLFGTPETLSADGRFLRELRPQIVTVCCAAEVKAMAALKAELPDTEVLGVTVLTTLDEENAWHTYHGSVLEAGLRFAQMALDAKLDGLVSAPAEASRLREVFGNALTINTPNVRPAWASVEDDDQNPTRVMTPSEAIKAGVDRIVVGRPILRHQNPYDAVMHIIEEIAIAAEQSLSAA